MKLYAFTATFLGFGDSPETAWTDARYELYMDDKIRPAQVELMGDYPDTPPEEPAGETVKA